MSLDRLLVLLMRSGTETTTEESSSDLSRVKNLCEYETENDAARLLRWLRGNARRL